MELCWWQDIEKVKANASLFNWRWQILVPLSLRLSHYLSLSLSLSISLSLSLTHTHTHTNANTRSFQTQTRLLTKSCVHTPTFCKHSVSHASTNTHFRRTLLAPSLSFSHHSHAHLILSSCVSNTIHTFHSLTHTHTHTHTHINTPAHGFFPSLSLSPSFQPISHSLQTLLSTFSLKTFNEEESSWDLKHGNSNQIVTFWTKRFISCFSHMTPNAIFWVWVNPRLWKNFRAILKEHWTHLYHYST